MTSFTIDVTVEDAPPPADDEDTLFLRTRGWWVIVKLLLEGFENSLDGDPRRLDLGGSVSTEKGQV